MNEKQGMAAGSGEIWADFWGGDHSIYVNARHAQVHYERLASDLVSLLSSRVQPSVLDWGCGDAFNAASVAGVCSELLLYDAVPAVQQRLARRFGTGRGIRVLGEGEWHALPSGSVDVIVLNSVAQYLSRADLENLLDAFRRVVHTRGEVIIADVIPPSAGMLPDILSLLGTGARNGFFLAACSGLARTFFSEYRRIRSQAGFSMYAQNEFIALFERHGFSAERVPVNVGFNQQRMTFRGRPRA